MPSVAGTALTPRQLPKPSEFCLPPTDWRTNKTPGGRSGKFFSKAERFPTEKCRFNDNTNTGPSYGTVQHTVKKMLPNGAGASFRSKTSQRPEIKEPLTGGIVSKPLDWKKQPFRANTPSATYRDKGDRFKYGPATTEFTGNVPKIDSHGRALNGGDRKVSAWTKMAGHETFLPG
jgi:hypothetical protein